MAEISGHVGDLLPPHAVSTTALKSQDMSLFIRNLLAASRGEDSSFTLQLVADRIKELELVERRESVQVSETHLDWAVCPVGLSAADASLYYSALLRGELKFEADTHIQELNGNHFFVQSFKLNERLLDDTDFFLHWGKDGAPWISQEVRPVDIAPRPEGGYFIRAKILRGGILFNDYYS